MYGIQTATGRPKLESKLCTSKSRYWSREFIGAALQLSDNIYCCTKQSQELYGPTQARDFFLFLNSILRQKIMQCHANYTFPGVVIPTYLSTYKYSNPGSKVSLPEQMKDQGSLGWILAAGGSWTICSAATEVLLSPTAKARTRIIQICRTGKYGKYGNTYYITLV